MNQENTKKLLDTYPSLYQQYYLSGKETRMCDGFACGDGWFSLIERLSAVLTHHEEVLNEKNDFKISIQVKQVKEKFGSLRFYVTYHDDYVRGAIAMAENLSLCIPENN